jgi:hypothetical protein
MSESYSLATQPEGVVASLLERFDSGKASAMMTLYEPEAVFIARDGRTSPAGRGLDAATGLPYSRTD